MSGFHPKDLIKEVKCRPGLFNKDMLEHPRREHKHQLWLEVGEKLTPQEDWESYTDVEKDARVDEIQAKWKHLRDHFYREIKMVNSGEAHKKRKYVYFDEMEFMRPYVGFKLPALSKMKVNYNDSLDDDSMYYMEDNDADEVMEEFLKTAENMDEEPAESPEPRKNPRRSIKPTPKMLAQKLQSSTPKITRVHKDVIKNFDVLKKTSNIHPASSTTAGSGGGAVPSFKIRDGDISFCLSLVPTFRKLSDSTKLRAKIEMLKILHKYVEHTERTARPQPVISRPVETNNTDDHHDMQEDHLEDVEDTMNVNVKHEDNDDPLNAASGNTKAWWT